MATKKIFNSLQAIRALSAILIVGHHVALYLNDSSIPILNKILFKGWVGVDIFFVLSGFLLFFTSYKNIGQKDRCKEFLFKRLSRIYPVYWIILTAVLIIWPSYFGGRYMIMDIIKSYLLVPQEQLPILGVAWFLSYIIFAYFVFAILIYFKKKTSYTVILAWVVGVLLNSFGLLPVNLYVDFIFSSHFIEIIAGCIVAVIFIKRPVKKPILSIFMGSIIFLGIYYLIIDGYIIRNSTESMFLFSLAVGLIILGCVSYELSHDIAFPKSVIALGDASYTIYLTHFSLLSFTDILNNKLGFHSIVELSFHIFVLILLGTVFYYQVEKRVTKSINILYSHKKTTRNNAAIEKRLAS
jgi:exopolysaccharide production protein ExoZ